MRFCDQAGSVQNLVNGKNQRIFTSVFSSNHSVIIATIFQVVQKVTFDTKQNFFFISIKEKVDRYFSERQIDPTGNSKLYVKSVIQVLSAPIIYTILVFFTPSSPWIALLLCSLLGVNLAIIGFNVMHEGGHQSFSKYKWLNRVSAYFLNVLGGNADFWKVKHNINHHTYTNIEGVDSDIDVRPFMRLHEGQPRHKLHRFQHFYWVFLYGISYVVWVYWDDSQKYFTGKIGKHMTAKKWDAKEHFIFWSTKIAYTFFYLILPILIVGWLKALIGFFVITFVTGLSISIVFQLAHVIQETNFPLPDKQTNKIQQEWAIHQVSTTANFATHSKALFWLLGGLNFQIEHHLFPRISHVHYPAISRFVKEACEEYNIAYHEHSSMLKAFISHLFFLKRLGAA